MYKREILHKQLLAQNRTLRNCCLHLSFIFCCLLLHCPTVWFNPQNHFFHDIGTCDTFCVALLDWYFAGLLELMFYSHAWQLLHSRSWESLTVEPLWGQWLWWWTIRSQDREGGWGLGVKISPHVLELVGLPTRNQRAKEEAEWHFESRVWDETSGMGETVWIYSLFCGRHDERLSIHYLKFLHETEKKKLCTSAYGQEVHTDRRTSECKDILSQKPLKALH